MEDYNVKCSSLDENDRILIQISLKLVPSSAIDNKLALVQVMVWLRTVLIMTNFQFAET